MFSIHYGKERNQKKSFTCPRASATNLQAPAFPPPTGCPLSPALRLPAAPAPSLTSPPARSATFLQQFSLPPTSSVLPSLQNYSHSMQICLNIAHCKILSSPHTPSDNSHLTLVILPAKLLGRFVYIYHYHFLSIFPRSSSFQALSPLLHKTALSGPPLTSGCKPRVVALSSPFSDAAGQSVLLDTASSLGF